MDWNLAGEMFSLFMLGVAYGAIAEAYMHMVEYRIRK